MRGRCAAYLFYVAFCVLTVALFVAAVALFAAAMWVHGHRTPPRLAGTATLSLFVAVVCGCIGSFGIEDHAGHSPDSHRKT